MVDNYTRNVELQLGRVYALGETYKEFGLASAEYAQSLLKERDEARAWAKHYKKEYEFIKREYDRLLEECCGNGTLWDLYSS